MTIPTPNRRCTLCLNDRHSDSLVCTAPIDKMSLSPQRLYHWACQPCRDVSPGKPLEPGMPDRADRFAFRALSIREPWAWLIAQGYKDCENRSKKWPFAGRVLLHASNGMTLRWDYDPAYKVAESFGIILPEPDFFKARFGRIVGVAYFEAMRAHLDSGWFFGPWAWKVRWAFPVKGDKCKGQLGMWGAPEGTGIAIDE